MLTRFCGGYAVACLFLACNNIGPLDLHAADAAGDTVLCTAPRSYGSPTLTAQVFDGAGAGSDSAIVASGNLNDDAKPDILRIELRNTGAGGITPGAYMVDSDPSLDSYSVCPVCVMVLASDTGGGFPGVGSFYLATTATLTITATSPAFTGSLSNVTLVHHDITFSGGPNVPGPLQTWDAFVDTEMVDPDGCTSSIASASLDAVQVTATP